MDDVLCRFLASEYPTICRLYHIPTHARTHARTRTRTRTRQIVQKEHLTSAQSYVHMPFKRHSAWQMLWAGSAFMTVCTTMFLSWDWLEERIIYSVRSQLRWRAEQRRADAGKLV